ncbi:hypothetical protein BHE74_00007487 [Ensete ventricosum]|nr:hypothetical protein BHE74_00007487 [Ensete ventricosum]
MALTLVSLLSAPSAPPSSSPIVTSYRLLPDCRILLSNDNNSSPSVLSKEGAVVILLTSDDFDPIVSLLLISIINILAGDFLLGTIVLTDTSSDSPSDNKSTVRKGIPLD